MADLPARCPCLCLSVLPLPATMHRGHPDQISVSFFIYLGWDPQWRPGTVG